MKFLSALIVLLASCPALAAAQVVINPAALRQLAVVLPPLPATVSVPPMLPAPKPALRHQVRRHVVLAVVKPMAVQPVPVPVAARVPPLPPAPQPAAAPAPASLIFAAGSAALPTNASTVIKPFCKNSGVIGIDARAPGDPSDPSIAMRLSLARALAVRDALTACGVPPQNILPRALGSVPGQNENETVVGVRN